jgi:hypothetical protein
MKYSGGYPPFIEGKNLRGNKIKRQVNSSVLRLTVTPLGGEELKEYPAEITIRNELGPMYP